MVASPQIKVVSMTPWPKAFLLFLDNRMILPSESGGPNARLVVLTMSDKYYSAARRHKLVNKTWVGGS